jgi:hypothetical protein
MDADEEEEEAEEGGIAEASGQVAMSPSCAFHQQT